MIGTTINQFQIESEIGRGGMGIVYKAKDTKLGRTVALKFLPASHHADDAAEARFIHEAKSISALDHPNVAVVHEIGQTDKDQLYIAMGYYTGETLEDIIARGPLNNKLVVDYALQIASGLQCAHDKGITHRDIKPGNVIVTESGLLKILDFGLAKVHDISMTAENLSVGTPAYISPEQSTGQPFDHRVDLWALGVVMYEMLTGKRPFMGDYPSAVAYGIVNEQPPDVRELRPDVPEELVAVMDRLLQKNPDDRYQTAAEVVRAFSNDDSQSTILDGPPASQAVTKMTGRAAITSMLSRDAITKTVIEVVPKHVVGFAGRLFYSVAVSLIAVVIGYFFQDYFFGRSRPVESTEQEITEARRNEARQHLQTGLDYLSDGSFGLALAEIESSVEKDSSYSPAWVSMAAAYLQLEQFDDAVTASNKAIAIDGNNDGAYYNLGFALSSQGKTDAAIAAFERATQINGSFTRAYSAWGDLLIESDRPAEALTVLGAASKTAEPQYEFLIFKNIGKAHMALGQYTEAIDYLESSYSKRETWPETSWLLAQSYEQEGRKAEAKAKYEYYLTLPIDPEFKKRARDRLAGL